MFIKLLCINDIVFKAPEYEICVKEGETIGALFDWDGVRIEYEKNTYSFPYNFNDVEKCFISAFDEETYNSIYKKLKDCKIYLDGKEIGTGEAELKLEK